MSSRHRLTLETLCLLLLGARDARAETQAGDSAGRATLPSRVREPTDSTTDGVYGRLDGDLAAAVGLLSELGTHGPAAVGRLSLHYFWTAGVYAGYAMGMTPHADRTRTVSVGVDLRPLFIPRWSQDWERGPALLDLTVDSLSLGFGVYWAEPRGSQLGSERGLEVSIGYGLPLLGRARGPWIDLRGMLRAADVGPAGAQFSLLIGLSWHGLVTTPWLSR